MRSFLTLLLSVVVTTSCAGDASSNRTVSLPTEPAATVKGVSISGAPERMTVGARANLAAIITNGAGLRLSDRVVVWESSNRAVLTVSSDGIVSAVGSGLASVTASVEGFKDTATIIVDPAFSLSQIENVVTGEQARLSGRALTSVTHISFDGTPVEFERMADSVLIFRVPRTRDCETDGRSVLVTTRGGDGSIVAVLSVPTVRRLRVGESVRLRADSSQCVQLAAADEDYLLTVLNPTIPPDRTIGDVWPPPVVDLMRLEFGPTKSSVRLASVELSARASDSSQTLGLDHGVASSNIDHLSFLNARNFVQSESGNRTSAPVPLDPAYESAAVGEVVRFPVAHRLMKLPGYCNFSRNSVLLDTVLSYPVRILASEGHVVIGVDLRDPRAALYQGSEMQHLLAGIARSIADYGLLAIREVMSRNYEPQAGGGGRHYVLLTAPTLYNPERTAWSGIAGDLISEMPQASCALSSEMHTVFLSYDTFTPASIQSEPGFAASVAIHEFSHQAEWALQQKAGQLSGNPEGWAVSVQEAAMRLALRTTVAAQYDELTRFQPKDPLILCTLWGTECGAHSPRRLWDPTAAYSQGALFLLHLRELYAESGQSTSTPTLWERIAAQRFNWTSFQQWMNVVAGLLRSTPIELLDRYSLAAASDDLVSGGIALLDGLPQVRSWDTRSFRSRANIPVVTRSSKFSQILSAGPGGYEARYLFADQSRGLSIRMEILPHDVPLIVRLTRLR